MTRPVTAAPNVAVAADARDAVAFALRLAFGTATPDDANGPWDAAFDAASRELLAPLAWARSSRFIRQCADGTTASAWRRVAMAAHLHGQRQLELLGDAAGSLDEAGVGAIVLKGLPLGERLYGDAFVRCSADIDLYIPASQRSRASKTLHALGWQRMDGEAPWHETWTLWRNDTRYHLELHSSLVSDHLAHLSVPPASALSTCVSGHVVQAHDGAFVAPYLAAHLATHQMPPLLWMVDFTTLWRSLSQLDQEKAESAARCSGLERYLDWARRCALLLDQAAAGDPEALGALGIDAMGRRDMHSIYRHLSLASSAADRARVAIAFLVPRPARGSLGAFMRHMLARLRTRLRSLMGASRAYATDGSDALGGPDDRRMAFGRPLRLERDAMVSLAGDVVQAGGALWVRAPGGSMLPTIARGALVRIEGLPSTGIEKGDVILALTGDGEPVLHRAVAILNDGITMRGDAAILSDPPVPMSRVIGIATHVRDEAGERALARSARRSVAITVLKLQRRMARVVRRAR